MKAEAAIPSVKLNYQSARHHNPDFNVNTHLRKPQVQTKCVFKL